jgi:hypothetical protein
MGAAEVLDTSNQEFTAEAIYSAVNNLNERTSRERFRQWAPRVLELALDEHTEEEVGGCISRLYSFQWPSSVDDLGAARKELYFLSDDEIGQIIAPPGK